MDDKTTKRSVLIAATLTAFMTPFMASSINVALPAIQQEFGLDAIVLAWISTSYLLATAIFVVPFGRAADIFGRRKVFVIGIVGFTLSSLMSAASVTTAMLMISRVLQGVASAMIFTTGMAILTSVFPPKERGMAIGLNVAAVYVSLSIGPFVGGILTEYLTWRSVFAVPVPGGIVACYFAVRKLRGEWADAKNEKFDLLGSVLYGMSMLVIMHGFSCLPSMQGIWEVISGLVLLAGFIRWELKTASPVLNIDLFRRNRAFALSGLAALINYSATFAVTFTLSLYLQYIQGLKPQLAGLVLVSQPIVMAALSPIAGRLSDRIQPQKLASLGMAITAIGLVTLTFLNWNTSIAAVVANLALLGLGFAMFSSPNMNAIMSSVDKKHYGIAASTVALMRLLGQMFSMGIVTIVFSLYIGPTQIVAELYPMFLVSIKIAFIIFAALCGLGIFASLARGKIDSLQGQQE
jgi:EmrB/QacA subfamily drug resistance transporter